MSESRLPTCNKERKPDPYTIPDVPEGEDEVSFERHNRVLKSEWSKSSRNALMVEQLMDRTFPIRRRSILETPTNVLTTFKQYPFLQDPTQVWFACIMCINMLHVRVHAYIVINVLFSFLLAHQSKYDEECTLTAT